jgi:chemotaxis protein methyltransferase WspC
MTARTVEHWLATVIGLDVQTIGARVLADAVKRRMMFCGVQDEKGYLDRLNSAPDECSALIEMMIVPETWFFRDREPFVFLNQFVGTTWLAAHPYPGAVLKVLSVPCSSGEEPYSIAMTLQLAGLTPARYRMDAMDISCAMLHKAETGDYGANSFRGGLLAGSERYFKCADTTRTIRDEVRTGIRFIHGNIMNPPASILDQTYDVIFCRNLLIYQHSEARARIMATLDSLLAPDGVLFVGHAEMMSLVAERYEPVRHGGAFAYVRRKAGPSKAKPVHKSCRELAKEPGVVSCAQSQDGQVAKREGLPVLSCDEPEVTRVDRVRNLADQGRLDEAASVCRELLKASPQLVEGHFLLGLISVAAGQVQEAEESLNRTLYLDADHYEALVHLSLLKAQQGDEAGAERLRRHAGRVHGKAKVPA